MQKQKKQFVILCVVLVVFVGLFFGIKAWQNHKEEQEAAAQEAERITAASLDVDEISEFSYQYEGTEITFVKEEDTWYDQEDKSITITQNMISTMLSNLSEITAEQQITSPEDTDQYGFDAPSNVIQLKMGDSTFTVTIGMQNEITGQYYLMVSDDDTVYLVDSTIPYAFQKSVEDLTEEEEEEAETDE